MNMSDENSFNQARDEHLVAAISRSQSALQLAIHDAVEAGLRVTVTVESMHRVGEHYSEPLVETSVERVIKLT